MTFKINRLQGVIFSCLLALTGCQVDDQKIVSSDDLALANPAPISRPFRTNFTRHRVLLAVLDSGVDYNHPLLINNMHFELDHEGNPVRLGKDFVANDGWPAPYVIRTSSYNPSLTAADRENSTLEANLIGELIQAEPELAAVLNTKRQIQQEYQSDVYHGTHVAGLMVNGRPDFGLLAYRVVPENQHADIHHDYRLETIDRIVQAIDQAAADGAKIVNLSLGINFSKAFQYDDANAQEEFRQLSEQKNRLEAVVRRYPNILFVAAAGNDSAWSDNSNRFQIPCGLTATNVLCVSALQDDGSALPSANMPIGSTDLVFALGHHLLSTIPTGMCIDEALRDFELILPGTPSDQILSYAHRLKAACLPNTAMGYMSGTSAAAPLVAHLAAEIAAAHPRASGQELIRRIKGRSIPAFIGNIPVYKLRIRRPTWPARE